MPTIEDQVKAAGSPREALLMLARAIDELRAEPTLNSWDGWGTAAPPPPQPTRDTTDPGRSAGAVRTITDDDIRAFMAQQFGAVPDLDDPEVAERLKELRKDLSTAVGESEPDHASVMVDEQGVVEIDWSPLSDEHRQQRYDFAKDVLQLPLALGEHPEGRDWCADYAEAGPMFLYIPNRELLLEYPESARRVMVEDLMSYDHQVAEEVARDLLRREASDRATAFPLADDYGAD